MSTEGACANHIRVVLCTERLTREVRPVSTYGSEYQRRRRQLPPPQGEPCPFCRLPMWPGQRLQADHAVPARLGGSEGPLRWAHGKCNEAAGARLGNRLRARRQGPRWVDRWA